MSVVDNGERYPLVQYFGPRKQKVITGYSTPGNTPIVVDILSQFSKVAGSSTNPETDSFVITAISLKAVCRVDATTLTSAQISPVWPDPIRRYLSTPSVRVLVGTIESLPTVVPPFLSNPVFSYADSPLVEAPFSSSGTIGPTVYPRDFTKPEYTIWQDETVEFPLKYVPDIKGVSTSRTVLPESRRILSPNTYLDIPCDFRFEEVSAPFPSTITHRDAVSRPFLMFVTDWVSGAPLLIHFNYQLNIIFHEK